jgi:hypothetical protein
MNAIRCNSVSQKDRLNTASAIGHILKQRLFYQQGGLGHEKSRLNGPGRIGPCKDLHQTSVHSKLLNKFSGLKIVSKKENIMFKETNVFHNVMPGNRAVV